MTLKGESPSFFCDTVDDLKGRVSRDFYPPKFFSRNNLSLPLVDILMNFNLGFDFAEIIVSKARFFYNTVSLQPRIQMFNLAKPLFII